MFVVCVNDASVMDAWKTNQGLAGSDLIDSSPIARCDWATCRPTP